MIERNVELTKIFRQSEPGEVPITVLNTHRTAELMISIELITMLNEIRIGAPSLATIAAFTALSRLPTYPPNISPVALSVTLPHCLILAFRIIFHPIL